MTRRNRIFAGLLLAYAAGVAFLLYRQLVDLDPRYRESAEESLVETAHLLAASIEQSSAGAPSPRVDSLEPVFRSLYARRFSADIYGVEKTRVELRATVVDRAGKVVFDSRAREVGADHSQWHDIHLALRGRYGARTTADTPDDPTSSVMYVAVPIRDLRSPGAAEIVGAVSVGKPVQSFGQFVEAARRKTLWVGATSVVAVALLVAILSVWLVRPFGLVADYVRYVLDERGRRTMTLPRLGRRAMGAIGAAYEEMRDALAGRNHVADYVQTLTHELKSPLSAIRGAAELLQEPTMPEADRARFAANIARESGRIQELVDRMMELTALESRKSLDGARPVAIGPLVVDVALAASPAAEARDVFIKEDVSAAGDAVVEGDAFLLHRALANLVDNAIDFSPPGTRIAIKVVRRSRTIDIHVRDQGPGIPDYAGDKVFEKFYSLPRPETAKKSTGLGLPFVREVAELHRGRAVLANARGGRGAVATLSLPLMDRPAPPPPAA